MKYVGDGAKLTGEGCTLWIERTLQNYETYGYGMSAIEIKASGELIGFVGLVHPGRQPEPELKYALYRSHWGRGFASEAGLAMVAFGRDSHGAKSIIATVDPEHIVSQRVLAKCGFGLRELRANEDGTTTAVWQYIEAP
jgi:RimJ/RimL family protein N-acetyltransferase